MLAGIPNWNSSGNTNNYLYTGQYYWTMSPCRVFVSSAVFRVDSSGYLLGSNVSWTDPGVRPVINLRADVQLTGSGTVSDPFVVVGAS